ncbi:zinc finger protein ZFP2-like, partial [Uranotaenia lowii]|uniref:zinc finger protein ZFP2-like n=1 Tax=Uranotaenia lowii TaxID=190385 RepID=UPI0024798E5B
KKNPHILDFEFHPIDEVKTEPPDDYEAFDISSSKPEPAESAPEYKSEPSTSSGTRLKSTTSDIYKKEQSGSASEPDGYDSGGPNFQDDGGGSDFENDYDDDDDDDYVIKPDKTEPIIETQKVPKRRGRPPKNAVKPYPEDSETSIVKKRKYRKRKIKSDSEDDDSDDEVTPRKSTGRRSRDERLFAHITEFVCYLCPERVEFDRFHHANLHYKELHKEPAYLKCAKCDRKCYTPGGFINHMETHEDPEKNKCNICGKVTDQKISLRKHMRAHQIETDREKPFGCSQCPRRFDIEKKRDKHERLHGRKIVFKREKGRDEELIAFYKKIFCDLCGNDEITYENFWDLKCHMTKEHNKTPYLKCPLCSKKNVCRQQLIVHIDVHENPDKYKCDICGEVNQFLERHKFKVHGNNVEKSDEKTFGCEHCGKMFRCESNLKNHIERVHAIKDEVCDICNKPFSKKALGAHKRTAHSEEMFMCEQCPKMFKTRSGLDSHKSEHDEELRKPVRCTICNKEMRRGASLIKHMKVIHSDDGPVNCNMCGKQFRTKFHMVRHRTNTCSATIDSRPFKCEVCGKGFSMRLTMTEHMTTHTRTSLYQCGFCFKTFGYISNLYKHRKKAHPEEWQEVQNRPDQGIATVIEMRN